MPSKTAVEAMTPGRRRDRPEPELVGRIEGWLRERIGPGAEISIVPRDSEAGGFSSDLFFVAVSGAGADERACGEWVLRRERVRDALFPEADFAAEIRIQRALAACPGVPVPAIPWVEEDPSLLDGRFYLMRRIHGSAPAHLNDRGWVAEATPEQRRRLWCSGIQTLAEIHAVDWRASGLACLSRAPSGESELAADVDIWWRLFQRHGEPVFPDLVHAAFARIRGGLQPEEPLALCWGDARHQNMLFRDFECVAVLDWEMATLGAPEKDVAFLLAAQRNIEESGVPRLEGFPPREETIALYESASGRTLRRLDYYEGFALLRMLVIQARFARLGLMPGSSQSVGENVVARLLKRFVEG